MDSAPQSAIRFAHRQSLALASIAMVSSLCVLSGCTRVEPQPASTPKLPAKTNAFSSSSGKPAMGSFNLNKRHGLGGWNKNSGPSEAQLMEGLSRLKAEEPQAGAKPASPLPSIHRSTRHVQ